MLIGHSDADLIKAMHLQTEPEHSFTSALIAHKTAGDGTTSTICQYTQLVTYTPLLSKWHLVASGPNFLPPPTDRPLLHLFTTGIGHLDTLLHPAYCFPPPPHSTHIPSGCKSCVQYKHFTLPFPPHTPPPSTHLVA